MIVFDSEGSDVTCFLLLYLFLSATHIFIFIGFHICFIVATICIIPRYPILCISNLPEDERFVNFFFELFCPAGLL